MGLYRNLQVISALAESCAAGRSGSDSPLHIPYRDSKLTKLLMDSLVRFGLSTSHMST